MSIVWKDKYNNLFSRGVTRQFGTNKIVKLYLSSTDIKTEHDEILASVLPLVVNPKKHGFIKFGEIK